MEDQIKQKNKIYLKYKPGIEEIDSSFEIKRRGATIERAYDLRYDDYEFEQYSEIILYPNTYFVSLSSEEFGTYIQDMTQGEKFHFHSQFNKHR